MGRGRGRITDTDRVRDRLVLVGRVEPADFLLPDVCDGGKPITRLAARIGELKQEGFPVVTMRKRPTAIYEHRPHPLVTVPENEPDWGDVSRYADETAQLSLEDAA